MEHIYSAGIITYTTDNNQIEYLLLHYNDGHWDFPKGKMEPGETKQETAQRELQEETGLVAQLHNDFEETFLYTFLNYDKQIAQKTVYFFVGRAINGPITLSEEHTDYQWLTVTHALEKLTYNNAKNLLKKAHKYLLSHKDLL